MWSSWDKFRLLIWKNWVLQYRRPTQTILEILAPLVLSVILVAIRNMVNPQPHGPIVYPAFCAIPLPGVCPNNHVSSSIFKYENTTKLNRELVNSEISSIQEILKKFEIMYSPYHPVLDKAMKSFGLVFKKVLAFNNSEDMQEYYMLHNQTEIFAGLQFDEGIENDNHLPDNINLHIRFPGELRSQSNKFTIANWVTNMVSPRFSTTGPRMAESITGATPNYYNEGFLALQEFTTLLLICIQKNITLPSSFNDTIEWGMALSDIADLNLPFITLRRFPYPQWQDDIFLTALESFIGLVLMLSFVYTCINTVRAITQEKEKQLKEAMRIMGLPSWLHWLAWFLKTLSYLMISISLVVILLTVNWYPKSEHAVFSKSNGLIMLLFLFVYVCATITFCFMVSVFFSKANTAASIAGLLWFFTFAPHLFLGHVYDELAMAPKLCASLAHNTAMSFGFQIIIRLESSTTGIQWSNLWSPVTAFDSLSLGVVMLMLVLDAVIYLAVAIYVEAVFPGKFGVPKPWHFIFNFGRKNLENTDDTNLEDFTITQTNGFYFERDPENLHPGIKIKNLKKTYGGKVVVKDLTLNMYEGQITVLLGHNGAGKTTTMSMLTGMIPSTSGSTYVNGYDIKTQTKQAKSTLGLCPQHNVIFDDLTVAEHLYFFGRLKGLREDDAREEVDRFVELLKLTDKKNAKAKHLSGGMKRKLCVGIALCGNSKVVLLDEPTAGMDPSARRSLWDLLLHQKLGRTILLTTHHMDEADLLGDRIAIMASGELQCCGTSFFLKKKFGAGYHLILDVAKHCNANKITELLKKHIPNIEIESYIGSELRYLLLENQSYTFKELLSDLENDSGVLGVNSFGISLTTIEEVFMKVGIGNNDVSNSEDSRSSKSNKSNLPKHDDGTSFNDAVKPQTLLSPYSFLKNQVYAMMLKKYLSIWRSWLLLCVQIAIPVAFLFIMILVNRYRNKTADLPSMPLDLSKFPTPMVLLEITSLNDSPWMLYQCSLQSCIHHKTALMLGTIQKNMIALSPNLGRDFVPIGLVFSEVNQTFMRQYELDDVFEGNVTAYFNNDYYHSPGIAMAAALNATYKTVLRCDNCSINFFNHPMPFNTKTKVAQLTQLVNGQTLGFQLAFNLSFSMAFVSSFYILFVIRERITKSKHLQLISGAKISVYWLTMFVCDLLTYILTILALLITLACFQEEGYRSFSELGRLSFLLLCFAWSALPMIYMVGFFFANPSSGFTKLTLSNVFSGCAAFLIIQLLNTKALGLRYIGDTLHWILLLSPHYCLASGVSESYTLYTYNKMCNTFFDLCKELYPNATENDCMNKVPQVREFCEDLDEDYYKWQSPGIGRNIFFLLFTGVIFLAFLIAIETLIFSKLIYKIKGKFSQKYPIPVYDEDVDVAIERNIIKTIVEDELANKYTLVFKDLTKYYKNYLAVNGLCLGVNKYECFGLLGVNGAGKTTTFRMITGDTTVTYGDAYVQGCSVKTELEKVRNLIGYCPQFDALLDDLTIRETLKIYALLRGLTAEETAYAIENLANEFEYYRHLDKQIKQLSGGNKRKLSTSLALIGDPPVIYLDEPTTGVDATTKRFLWNTLCQIRDRGKCIVLTSHSMEECEALCTRIAVMVNGTFKCLGSTQHLKSKFAEGFTITIKIRKPEDCTALIYAYMDVEKFIRKHFGNAILREKHDELLTYHVTDRHMPWSRMFGIMERAKRVHSFIEDYSLGQSSLEQVFLTFTKHQI